MKVKLIAVALLYLAMGTTVAQVPTTNNSLTNKQTTKNMTAKEVVEAYSVALSKGDIPTAFSYFSPNAKWHQPGNNKFSGTQSGLEAIGKMLSDMMGATQGSLVVKPTDPLMVNGNFVSSPVRFSAKSGDKTVEMNGNDLYEVLDGKIVQVWLFSEDQDAEDKFWGK
jgi:ketosteroid isomerase-like protein